MRKKGIMIVILIMFFTVALSAWDLSNKINLSCLFNHISRNDDMHFLAGLEYYPGFQFEVFKQKALSMDCFVEGQITADLSSADIFNKEADIESDADAEIYRMWLRSLNPTSEFRIGLQKINFGPAVYLRSLQWFDQIDPRDSSQRTKGVWAGLLRYYLVDNSNFWFWGIYEDEKENYYLYSKPEKISAGGRMQLPLFEGEIALSFHQREIGQYDMAVEGKEAGSEQRYGFDGRWDHVIGMWVESSCSVMDDIIFLPTRYEFHTLGCDYTINAGNGLHVLSEAMFYTSGDGLFDMKNRYEKNAVIAVDMPIGLYDSILGLCLYSSITDNYYYYLSYALVFDYIKFDLNLSISTENSELADENIGFASGQQIELQMQIDF